VYKTKIEKALEGRDIKSLNEIKDNKKLIEEQRLKDFKVLKSFNNIYMKTQSNLLLSAMFKMSRNSKPESLAEKLKQSAQLTLIIRLINSSNAKSVDGLNRFRNYLINYREKVNVGLKRRNILLNKLMNACNSKTLQCLSRMRDNNNSISGKSAKEAKRKNFLFKKLVDACNGKLKQVMSNLKTNKAEVMERLSKEQRIKNRMIRRLLEANSSRCSEAFRKLCEKKDADVLKEQKRQSRLKQMLDRLSKAQAAKQAQVMKITLLRMKDSSYATLKKEMALEKILRNLSAAQSQKVKELSEALVDHSKLIKNKEEQKKAAKDRLVRYVFEKASEKTREDLAYAKEKLKTNALAIMIRKEREKKLLNDICHVNELRVWKVVYALKMNKVVKNLHSARKDEKFINLLNKLNNRFLGPAMSKLRKNRLTDCSSQK
jgi:hypothetical protein